MKNPICISTGCVYKLFNDRNDMIEILSKFSPTGIEISFAYKISKEVLKKISKLYKQINARNVVFHKGQIENYELILNNKFEVSIENDDWRKPEHNIEDIKRVLDKYKKFKFTFDFAHVLSVSSSDISKYLSYFKDRVFEIHLSIVNKELVQHDFLHKYDSEEIRELLQPLKAFSVPVILEGVVTNLEEIELIKKEIEYIKNL